MPRTWEQVQDTVVAAQQNYGPANRVTSGMLDVLFTCLLRAVSFFDEARRFLRGNQFNAITEAHYAILWEVLCVMRDNNQRFNYSNVCTELHRLLSSNPGVLHPNFQPFLLRQGPGGLIWTAFNLPTDEIDVPTARQHLREFLHERTVSSPLRRFMENVSAGDTPLGLDDFLDSVVTQRQRIASMQTLPLVTTVPALDAEMRPPSIFHPTGMEWIDMPLGGIREGDAIGIIGGTGSGKSTLCAHMAVACAKREWELAAGARRLSRWVALFTYEEAVAKMQPRVWSAGCQIARSRLERLTNPATQLTRRDNMEPYERKLYGDNEQDMMCEQERWSTAGIWMNKTIALFDMSGSADFPDAGYGYIPEITACLEARTAMLGIPPVFALIDYAGIVCRNYMAKNNMDDSSLRHLLSEFGNRARREIAERFGCTVCILHQIAPAEGQRHPTALMHHSMAAESRAFAENLAACACIGNPDPLTGCRRLNWSKIRYQAQERVEPVTLKINDEFATIDNVTSIYTVDDAGRRFVLRNAMNQIHGGERTGTANTVPTANPPRVRQEAAPITTAAAEDMLAASED